MTTIFDVVDEAREAIFEGRFDEARVLLDQARRIDGRAVAVQLLEIDLLEAQGMSEEALSAAEEALEGNSSSMLLRFVLAQLFLDIYDDVKEARPHLEALAVRINKGEQPDVDAPTAADKKALADEFAVELWLSLADVRGADHDPRAALTAAQKAVELDPEDAIARVTKGACLFDLCEVDEAEKLAAQAIDLDSRCADGYWLRGRVLSARGQHDEADKSFSRAVKLDSDRFQAPYRLSEDAFAEHLERAIEELPEKLRAHMKNVSVIVQDLPDMESLRSADPPLSPSALGLFDPEPLAPGASDGQPVRIFLFRKNLETACFSEEEMIDEIGITLLHELGHFFGLDEDDLDERGLN
jgi:predicted Zn-dependent protease with MMP-like domain/predicted negative regulator of RcsB-dependent stress response